jgi:hypothetical protein
MAQARMTYLAVYEGKIMTRLEFNSKKEALDYWKTVDCNVFVPGDPHRLILRDNKTTRNIKDTWYPNGAEI